MQNFCSKGIDSDTVVIREPRDGECGGTTETLDRKAPKEISSHDIVLFTAESALGFVSDDSDLTFVSAYAAPSDRGTFVYYEYANDFRARDTKSDWAFIKENASAALDALTVEQNFIADNGHFSKTHGLPENFGGSVRIMYASGETISFSDNQSPVFSLNTAKSIDRLFKKLLKKPRAALPDVEMLKRIEFEETRKVGYFTRACLTVNPDGTALNKKQACYGDPKVYESEKPVDAETVRAIKEIIRQSGIVAWPFLPEQSFSFSSEKTLRLVFAGGEEITVPANKLTPDRPGNAFFNIELELVTKH